MLTINDFSKPTGHPFDLLNGYTRAYEKKSVLAWMLAQCVEAGSFGPVNTTHNHPEMVSDGLLLQTGDREYALTQKAKGLLYGYYGKETTEAQQ